jgi:hypothetical protein
MIQRTIAMVLISSSRIAAEAGVFFTNIAVRMTVIVDFVKDRTA